MAQDETTGGEHDDNEMSLVMPFVVTTDNGGPFDSSAYVAGCEFGSINRMLDSLPPEVGEVRLVVRTDNVPQFDLAAMHHEMTFAHEPWKADPSWSYVWFVRHGYKNTDTSAA